MIAPKFQLHERAKRDGHKRLRVYFRVAGKKQKYSLDFTVHPDDWDEKKEQIRPSDPAWQSKNLKIRELLQKLFDAELVHIAAKIAMNPESFWAAFKKPTSREDFFEFYEISINNRLGTVIGEETAKHDESTLNKLRRFRSKIRFSEINYQLVMDFIKWLRTEKLNENTIQRHLKTLKVYLQQAKINNISFSDPFEHIKVKSIKGNRDYLRQHEIKKLITVFYAENTPANYVVVLAYFLFSCFTGLRISDVLSISRKNIVDGNLVFVPRKTKNINKRLSIPLSPAALQFIDPDESKPLFPVKFTEQSINKILKLIQAYAGIPRLLYFHLARHTFGTNFILLGGNLVILKDLMGHADIKTTMVYVHMAEEETNKIDQIKLFDVFAPDRVAA